ncbi:hypothetical protein MNV49_006588 [Pseudohyphozyma bogoriensis]|nr:hypothetical protein MNV49_006588 [Pseudohyphozyma bogoriensis]
MHLTASFATFREELVSRDGFCVLSNVRASACDASHFIPETRSDIYEDVLGPDFTGYRYEPVMGILLSQTLHALYDQYQWVFLLQGWSLIVHVFTGYKSMAQYHGLVIPASRCRTPPGNEPEVPDPRLCEWHYAQCVQKSIRGFSAGLSASAM